MGFALAVNQGGAFGSAGSRMLLTRWLLDGAFSEKPKPTLVLSALKKRHLLNSKLNLSGVRGDIHAFGSAALSLREFEL